MARLTKPHLLDLVFSRAQYNTFPILMYKNVKIYSLQFTFCMVMTVSASSDSGSLCKKSADQHGILTSNFRLQSTHVCAIEAVCRMGYGTQWSAILCICVGIINISITTTQYF